MRRRPGGSRVIRGAACATAELQRHCRIRGALHSPCRHRPELRAGVEIPKPKQRFVLEKKPLRRALSRLDGVRLHHPMWRGLRPADCARRGQADHVGRAKIPIRCGSRTRHARPTWVGIYVRRSQLLHHRPPSTALGAGHLDLCSARHSDASAHHQLLNCRGHKRICLLDFCKTIAA
jgi:hypothetical protein